MLNSASKLSQTITIDVDSCIIDEQPDHIVLAVRLPREMIARNHALFGALSERASSVGGPARSGISFASALPLAYRRKSPTITLTCAIITAAVALTFTGSTAVTRPPIENFAAQIETPVVRIGGEFIFSRASIRHRLCKASVERLIVRESDEATVWRQSFEGVAQAVTTEPVHRRIIVRLPEGLAPGRYFYRSTTFSDCGSDGHFHTPLNKLPFTVVAGE